MKINHLIVGSVDVEKSTSFYVDLFGFKKVSDDPGAVGGQVLQGEECDLLVLPFGNRPLPNPAHFAFEVSDLNKFEELLNQAKKMGLEPRSEPSRNSKPGAGEFKRGLKTFKQFYIFDPAGTNVEVMTFV